ncbi:hypothetical protein QQ020_25710 [Fulvivirgaceae bacterium BMA12]|uniref:Phosphatase PAP2 family protein n=1 Tax=Agaribacillus aureus TaxID=3051825 RepID=A0ABT8LEL8_9BACT|nr:hypothetical protein [Fulvivirgaceae bacterium BMA12]
MSNRIAKIVSIVLHPLLMPTIVFAILLYFVPLAVKPLPDSAFFQILMVIFFLTYVLPLVSVSLIRLNYVVYFIRVLRLKYVKNMSYNDAIAVMNESEDYSGEFSAPKSIWMKTKEERVIPFIFITVYYGLCAYLFIAQWKFNDIFGVILVSITTTIFLVTLITTKWKISAHSAGIAGAFGFIMGVNLKYPDNQLLYPILALVVLAGLVMTSRLQLNDHDSKEVYAGALLGFAVSFGAIYFFV